MNGVIEFLIGLYMKVVHWLWILLDYICEFSVGYTNVLVIMVYNDCEMTYDC